MVCRLSVVHSVGRSNDDGAGHKAALLSGPPGIGKTTTAQIVCQVLSFHITRSSGFYINSVLSCWNGIEHVESPVPRSSLWDS